MLVGKNIIVFTVSSWFFFYTFTTTSNLFQSIMSRLGQKRFDGWWKQELRLKKKTLKHATDSLNLYSTGSVWRDDHGHTTLEWVTVNSTISYMSKKYIQIWSTRNFTAFQNHELKLKAFRQVAKHIHKSEQNFGF